MARIQIVPIPGEKAGIYEDAPFILVLDQLGDDVPILDFEALKESMGARTVIAWDGTLDAPGALEIDPGMSAILISRFTA